MGLRNLTGDRSGSQNSALRSCSFAGEDLLACWLESPKDLPFPARTRLGWIHSNWTRIQGDKTSDDPGVTTEVESKKEQSQLFFGFFFNLLKKTESQHSDRGRRISELVQPGLQSGSQDSQGYVLTLS